MLIHQSRVRHGYAQLPSKSNSCSREADSRWLGWRRRRRIDSTTHLQSLSLSSSSLFITLFVYISCYLICITQLLPIVDAAAANSFQNSNFSPNSRQANLPPRFKSPDDSTTGDFDLQSEIVVRVKEGASSLNKEIYHLYGEDPDGDSLQFGVLGTLGKDLLRIESVSSTEARIHLKKELDREIQDSYTLVLTLTDGKLGKGNYVISLLIFF